MADFDSNFESALINFPVNRMQDNRLLGLLRELGDAINQEQDPATLRRLGQSLKMIGDHARSKAFWKTKEHW
jgi:hypothetical protein